VLIFIQKIDFFVKINLFILGMIGKIDHVTAKFVGATGVVAASLIAAADQYF